MKAGDVAGSNKGNGYWAVTVNNVKHYTHRIIWEMFNGPLDNNYLIDHIDQNTRNNIISNMRIASKGSNATNAKKFKNNTSGYKGVSSYKDTGRFIAYICPDKKKKHLGIFDTAEDAARAYDMKALELFGEYALTNEMLGLYKQKEPES
jgi:hypothetical protein